MRLDTLPWDNTTLTLVPRFAVVPNTPVGVVIRIYENADKNSGNTFSIFARYEGASSGSKMWLGIDRLTAECIQIGRAHV